MNKITKGSKIQSNKFKTIHIVEHVEIIDDLTLVYTEDIKCFPITEVELVVPLSKKLCNLFYSWVSSNEENHNPEKETTNELERLLKSDYTVEMIDNDFDRMIKDLNSK